MFGEGKRTKTISPEFRFALKARIIEAGYRTLTDFSREAGVDLARISKIISGWELPGPKLQRSIAKHLGITITELNQLLKE